MKKQFFNKTLNFFKDHKITNKKMIVGVSGGLDSVVLLDLLKELSTPCQLKLYVVYIHHGKSSKKNITTYREKAEHLVSKLSQSYDLDFISPPAPKKNLKSEEDFRNLRHSHLKKILKRKKADFIVLAHTQQDLLETRLIQMIRGCGEQGLKSMSLKGENYLRPLLFWSREEVTKYAKQNKLKWREDPSNKDNSYLRNWIRNKWLKDLEKKRAGSAKSLFRSLDSLIISQEKESPWSLIKAQGIQRNLLMEMPLKEQKRVLAFYMRQKRLSNYGQSHIDEILKQAERKEKNFSIPLLKKTWIFNQDYISIK